MSLTIGTITRLDGAYALSLEHRGRKCKRLGQLPAPAADRCPFCRQGYPHSPHAPPKWPPTWPPTWHVPTRPGFCRDGPSPQRAFHHGAPAEHAWQHQTERRSQNSLSPLSKPIRNKNAEWPIVDSEKRQKVTEMRGIILWILGVPVSVIILLYLFNFL